MRNYSHFVKTHKYKKGSLVTGPEYFSNNWPIYYHICSDFIRHLWLPYLSINTLRFGHSYLQIAKAKFKASILSVSTHHKHANIVISRFHISKDCMLYALKPMKHIKACSFIVSNYMFGHIHCYFIDLVVLLFFFHSHM